MIKFSISKFEHPILISFTTTPLNIVFLQLSSRHTILNNKQKKINTSIYFILSYYTGTKSLRKRRKKHLKT